MPVFPGATTAIAENKTDGTATPTDHKDHHNQLADELNAVTAELGVNPKGPFATTVGNRFEILDWKRSCRVASVGANIAGTYAAGPPATKAVGGTSFALDGVTTVNGDRVFLKDQTTALENGLYQVSGVGTAIVLTRTYDADDGSKLSDNMYVSVEQGAVNADTTWELISDNPITVGTTALRFSRVAPSYTPGNAKDWWEIGATATARPAICTNLPRMSPGYNAGAGATQTAITALTSLHGGMVIPAGKVITNINAYCNSAGAGAVTTMWFAIVRATDRVVLERTANVTSLPAVGVYTRALQAAITLDADTPVYIAWASQVATTSPAFLGVTGQLNAYNFVSPIMAGNSTTAPTATPAAVGAVLAAPTSGIDRCLRFWLT